MQCCGLTAAMCERRDLVMENFMDVRIEIVKIHYRNGESFADTGRKCYGFLGHHNAPSRRINSLNSEGI